MRRFAVLLLWCLPILMPVLVTSPLLADVRVEDPVRYHEIGLRYMKEEKWNLAVEQLEKSLAAKADDFRVWVDLGDALCVDPRGVRYGNRERNEKAAAAYRKAADLNPTAARAWNNLAWLRAKTGVELDEGLVAAKRAVEIEEARSGYLDTLAEIHFARGEVTQAQDAIRRALLISPDDDYLQRQRVRFGGVRPEAKPAAP